MTYDQQVKRAALDTLRRAAWLYHVSRPENRPSIKAEGLKPFANWTDFPAVFFFADRTWAHSIAASVFIAEFDLWRFRRSTLPRRAVEHDAVGEFYSRCSFYTRQPIPPHALEFVGTFKLDWGELYDVTRSGLRQKKEFMTPEQIEGEARLMRLMNERNISDKDAAAEFRRLGLAS